MRRVAVKGFKKKENARTPHILEFASDAIRKGPFFLNSVE